MTCVSWTGCKNEGRHERGVGPAGFLVAAIMVVLSSDQKHVQASIDLVSLTNSPLLLKCTATINRAIIEFTFYGERSLTLV